MESGKEIITGNEKVKVGKELTCFLLETLLLIHSHNTHSHLGAAQSAP